jgi:hypothetical protein
MTYETHGFTLHPSALAEIKIQINLKLRHNTVA